MYRILFTVNEKVIYVSHVDENQLGCLLFKKKKKNVTRVLQAKFKFGFHGFGFGIERKISATIRKFSAT